jgi:rfaE bifunctional protein kinase chain/domain
MFGVIGSGKSPADEPGESLRKDLRAANISDAGVIADARRITTVKTRIIARHQHIVRVDRERREALHPDTQGRLLRALSSSLKNLDALVVSDYNKGIITDDFAEKVLGAAHKLKVPVFIGPKRSMLYAYRGAKAIVCNLKEAGEFLAESLTDEKSVDEAASKLLPHFGCEAVLITRGEKGMTLFEESSPRPLHIPATSFEVTYARVGKSGIDRGSSGRQVFDVTGAGDTVLSVLALAAAAGAPLSDAARLANAAAGVVVGKLGTASVTPDELLHLLNELSR